MPIQVDREKWILYKHINNYEMIKTVALLVKNQFGTKIDEKQRRAMQKSLEELNYYNARNRKSLDSIGHRINTLEYYLFGYQDRSVGRKRFIFSPLGNLFIKYVQDPVKLKYIFSTMLFGVQYENSVNKTPRSFHIYPFRLLLQLMNEPRLNYRLYSAEYAYIVAFTHNINPDKYENLVEKILEFRKLPKYEVAKLMKEDEHTYVNCVYEWQYYNARLLQSAGILKMTEGDEIVKLYHPTKSGSKSMPTHRSLKDSYTEIVSDIRPYIDQLLKKYTAFQEPIDLNAENKMRNDAIKQVYSFYPPELLEAIGEKTDDIQTKLLQLPNLIEKYSNNPDNSTAYSFEKVLEDGFNMFYNVEAQKIGGAGHTDIECLYLTKRKKFDVEAKSTEHKLLQVNAGRLKQHRKEIGSQYTIVVTPRYVPATKRDIEGENIVLILASTFSEYLYNHIYHDVREIDYEDFDNIIEANLGTDVSDKISEMTMAKFAESIS
jgi:hypothetical protein